MSQETGKATVRRLNDHRFTSRYFVGTGIDIGSGDDSLSLYGRWFPMSRGIVSWDKDRGDATDMEGVAANTFDFVHSSHCLEHLDDPTRALTNWIRICKPGGHLVIVVPDEGLYEQGVWPSTFNPDHKHNFSISGGAWKPDSVVLQNWLPLFAASVSVLKLELLDAGYTYGLARMDQSAIVSCETGIEVILRKRT